MTSPSDLVTAGRALAESLMLDTCTITRPGTQTGGIDPSTGLPAIPDPTTVYTGSCKIQRGALEAGIASSGEHVFTEERQLVHIPATASGVKVGDTITITATGDVDSSNAGRTFLVVGLAGKTFATAQRLQVEETTA